VGPEEVLGGRWCIGKKKTKGRTENKKFWPAFGGPKKKGGPVRREGGIREKEQRLPYKTRRKGCLLTRGKSPPKKGKGGNKEKITPPSCHGQEKKTKRRREKKKISTIRLSGMKRNSNAVQTDRSR